MVSWCVPASTAADESAKPYEASGCKDTLIIDEWRKAVLGYHNRIRRRVAEGKQPTGAASKFMPAADKLLELEKIVQLLIIVTVSEATSFGCRNTLISDEWRQRVLDHHNNIRRKVSQGIQETGGGPGKFMPKAGKIYELNWDCDMENNAFLSTCDQTVQIPQAYASNSATFQITGKKCDINQNTMAVLKGWSDQAVAVDLSGGAVYNVQNQKEFGIMVFGETTGFACSYSQCGNDGKLLCLYNKQAPQNGNQLYDTPTADICDKCPADAPCTAWICKTKEYTLDTNANPQPMCANPGDDGMTHDMQVTAMDMANYYRSLGATGWALDKNGYAPTAKDMNALKYDCDTVGKDAKIEADKCTATSYTPTGGYVLNFYKSDDYTMPREEVLRKAIASWFGQLKNVDLDEKALYNNDVQTSAKDFANLVYGKATKVGCAVTLCLREGFQVAICQFDSTGVTPDDSLYTVGKTCSGCNAAGKTCHKGLLGICA
ncbi:hypothetical protein Y032_0048g1655 [Ancylostoma ceylanicum]|nr:hypothetical protein Y032_0048g1655 [Ancylostoma ceylanicum]